jgi:mono/diheme cytochrome c family protein
MLKFVICAAAVAFSLVAVAAEPSAAAKAVESECPLAGQYAPRLGQLEERFSKQGVALLGIASNQQDSFTRLAEFAKTHEINFPLLKDTGNVVADQVGAERTPEVFVLDQERRVRYRGRIDDQFVVGRQRSKATREDLIEAIAEVLAGREVTQPVTDAQGCRIGRVQKPRSNAAVTYSEQVAAVFNRRCVECHRTGEIAPFPLTNYAEVVGWAETIAEVVNAGSMPPWHANPEYGHFANDRRLSDADRKLINDWVEAGAPEGDPKQLPPTPQFADGWRLPRLDLEVFMPVAYDVPAEGTVNYQYFTVDPGFTEDKWVQGAQCRPGNPAVVHHIIAGIRPPRGRTKRRTEVGPSEWLTATAPGAAPLLLADGMAKLIPAGSKLVFQMHYTPNGRKQSDRSSVGLMFADPARVRKEVATIAVENHFLMIPPQRNDYRAEAWHKFDRDTVLLALFPHMHLRGKAFRYELRMPGGQSEVLLDVPRYDFAWQSTYVLEKPRLIPKGAEMHCVAHYDNSPENIANPNPNRVVTWGDQTWDEMMIGYFDATTPDEDGVAAND